MMLIHIAYGCKNDPSLSWSQTTLDPLSPEREGTKITNPFHTQELVVQKVGEASKFEYGNMKQNVHVFAPASDSFWHSLSDQLT